MPNWNEVLETVQQQNAYDSLRKQYISRLSKHTGRNTIIYYSGWLQKPGIAGDFSITDSDKMDSWPVCIRLRIVQEGSI